MFNQSKGLYMYIIRTHAHQYTYSFFFQKKYNIWLLWRFFNEIPSSNCESFFLYFLSFFPTHLTLSRLILLHLPNVSLQMIYMSYTFHDWFDYYVL